MPSSNSIAVVIVNWNAGPYLRKCLQSLKAQTLKPLQVLIVDNASIDDSMTGLEEEFENYEIIRLESNKGFAFANNLAVKKVDDCNWIAFLNPDAFAHPEWLEKLNSASEKFHEYKSFGSHMLKHGTDRMDGTGDVYHVCGSAWRRDFDVPSLNIDRKVGEIFSPCAAASFISKDIFLEVGGFDENFFAYFEDVDLGFRLQLRGYGSLYIPNAVIEHVGSATTSRYSDFAIYHSQRNLVWSYFRNMPNFWYFLPQHILFNLVSLIWFAIKGKARVVLQAKWHALREFPRIWALRKLTQHGKTVDASVVLKKMNHNFLMPYARRKRLF